MNVLNSKVCKGLNFTSETVASNTFDLEGLLLSTDWSSVPVPEEGWKDSESGAVAACRAWYDATEYEKPFCCQMWMRSTLDKETRVAHKQFTVEVFKAKKMAEIGEIKGELEGVNWTNGYGAKVFRSAQSLTGVTAILAAIMVYVS